MFHSNHWTRTLTRVQKLGLKSALRVWISHADGYLWLQFALGFYANLACASKYSNTCTNWRSHTRWQMHSECARWNMFTRFKSFVGCQCCVAVKLKGPTVCTSWFISWYSEKIGPLPLIERNVKSAVLLVQHFCFFLRMEQNSLESAKSILLVFWTCI